MKKVVISIVMLLVISLVAIWLPACAKPAPASAPAPSPAPAPAPAPVPAPVAHPIVSIANLCGGRGTSPSILGSGIEDMLKKEHPWLRAPVGVTSGSAYNWKLIDANPSMWTTAITDGTFENIFGANNAFPPFDKVLVGFVPLIHRFSGNVWLATLKPDLKTLDDLVGKKIALGQKSQTLWCMGMDAVLQANGLGAKSNIMYVGNHEAMVALLDGLADAAIVGGYCNPITKKFIPGADLVELMASGKKVYAIPLTEEHFTTVRTKMKFPLKSYVMPPDPSVGIDKDTLMILQLCGWFVKDVFPEDVAYEYVKFWVKNGSRLKDYHQLGQLITPDVLPIGNDAYTFHPGALRAYKEAGVPIPGEKK